VESHDPYATLPESYATALRLRAAGASQAEVARQLSIEADAIPALLRLAEAKLAAAKPASSDVEPGSSSTPDGRTLP
jgi:transcriptional regulator